MGKKYIREIITDYLHNNNLSLTKFAKKCDLSPSYMSQVIRNKNVVKRIDFYQTEVATKAVNPASLVKLTVYPRLTKQK